MPYKRNTVFTRSSALAPLMGAMTGRESSRFYRAVADIASLYPERILTTVCLVTALTAEEFAEGPHIVAETIYDALTLHKNTHPMASSFLAHLQQSSDTCLAIARVA